MRSRFARVRVRAAHRDYYLKDDTESKRVRSAYQMHLETIFTLAGESKAVAKKNRETVMKIETAISSFRKNQSGPSGAQNSKPAG